MAIKPQAFAELDDNLSQKLGVSWGVVADSVAKKIGKAVEAGEHQAVSDLLDRLDLSGVIRKHKDDAELSGRMAFLFGVSRLSEGDLRKSKFVSSKDDKGIVVASVVLLEKMARWSNKHLKPAVMKAIDRAEQQVTKGILKELVTSEAAAALRNAGQSSLFTASSLHSSRLAQYGYCVEAELRGVEAYIVNEVLDNRTCQFCEQMHGRVFSLDVVYARLDQLIRMHDPADLIAMAPFPAQDKASLERYKTMTNSELQTAGLDTPPYHPLCRGYLDDISAIPQWEIINITGDGTSSVDYLLLDKVRDAVQTGTTNLGTTDIGLAGAFGDGLSD